MQYSLVYIFSAVLPKTRVGHFYNCVHSSDAIPVLLICHTEDIIYRLMMTAYRLGMTSPDYVYIYFTSAPSQWTLTPWVPSLSFGDKSGNISQKELMKRKEIFQSLKQVTTGPYPITTSVVYV